MRKPLCFLGIFVLLASCSSNKESSKQQIVAQFAPIISSLDPNFGSKSGGTSITIKGSGFTRDSIVKFAGIASPRVLYVDMSTLIASTPAVNIGATLRKVVDVSVEHSGGSFNLPNSYTYIENIPVAMGESYSIDQDTSLYLSAFNGVVSNPDYQKYNLLANDIDFDNDRLEIKIKTNPTNGTLYISPDKTAPNKLISYVPNLYYSGSDSFTYTVSDGSFESGEVRVEIDVKYVEPKVTYLNNNTIDLYEFTNIPSWLGKPITVKLGAGPISDKPFKLLNAFGLPVNLYTFHFMTGLDFDEKNGQFSGTAVIDEMMPGSYHYAVKYTDKRGNVGITPVVLKVKGFRYPGDGEDDRTIDVVTIFRYLVTIVGPTPYTEGPGTFSVSFRDLSGVWRSFNNGDMCLAFNKDTGGFTIIDATCIKGLRNGIYPFNITFTTENGETFNKNISLRIY